MQQGLVYTSVCLGPKKNLTLATADPQWIAVVQKFKQTQWNLTDITKRDQIRCLRLPHNIG